MQPVDDTHMPEGPPTYGSNAHADLRCPRCGGGVVRTRRHAFDRLVSLISPRLRFRCAGFGCDWEGTLRVKR
jgi:hypothetical protein